MNYDTKTISLIIVIISFFLGIAMLIDWSHKRTNKPSAMWAAGNGALSLGWLLLSLRGVINDFLSIVIANTLIALCFSFLIIGTQWFLQLRGSYKFSIGVAIAVFVGQVFWLITDAPVEIRIVYVPSLLAVLSIYCAWILVIHDDGRSTYPQRAIATILGTVGIVSLLVAVSFLIEPKSMSSLFERSTAVAILFLTYLMGVIGWSMGFLIMTRQRQSQDLLIQNEILENIVEGVSMIRKSDATIAYANSNLETMFGYGPDELIGTNANVLYAVNLIAANETSADIARYFERCKKKPCEVHSVRKDGTKFWCKVRASVFRHVQFGEVLVSVHEDITTFKQADEALREGNRKLSTLLDNLPGMAYRCANSMNWDMQFVTDGAQALIGYTSADLVSQKVAYGNLILPEDAEYVWETVQEKVRQKHSYVLEYRIRTSSGQTKWVWEKGMGVFSDDDQLLALEGFITDITERKLAETERARLQRELQQSQKMEALGHLTGGVAHEFNNILGVIMGNAELALNHSIRGGQPELVAHLKRIEQSGERARDLVLQMLAFSRNETPKIKPMRLQPLVNENLELLRSTLPASVEINAEIEENLPAVLVDAVQIYQVLMNICVNARDAMEEKGDITIRLGLANGIFAECTACRKSITGDWVELSVTDAGSGISPVVLEHIFDPFYTTKDIGKGTGLGLSAILGIMHNLGGHILVETELGEGTTFRLLFPPVIEESNELPEEMQAPVELLYGQGEQVLVLDDEPELADFLGALMESYGYRTTVLTSSKEAIKLFNEKPGEFALLITDQTMPGLTGIELVKSLRKLRPDLPVILNTGFSEAINAETANKLDIHYMEKPINAESLIQVVGELLKSTKQATK
ncbi:MAG: PAS domain S-box protein [Gammaproteobacteria bacterium]|nr:PAS domain S-box protein [Gammaproteobacteria bacterium]